jgi:hypothetical protein
MMEGYAQTGTSPDIEHIDWYVLPEKNGTNRFKTNP